MDNKIDRELLQQLHDEINNTQTVDEKGKELLRDLDGDIRALLERADETQRRCIHPLFKPWKTLSIILRSPTLS